MSTSPDPASQAPAINPMHKLVGAVMLLMVLLWGALGSGDMTVFIDRNSMIWVFGIIAAGLWMCFGPGATLAAFRNAIFGKGNLSQAQHTQMTAVLSRAYQLAWAGGLSGFLLGLVIMLSNMDDPAALGPGMAYSLLTTIYGLILAEFIFSPLQHFQHPGSHMQSPRDAGIVSNQKSMMPIGFCFIAMGCLGLLILILSLEL